MAKRKRGAHASTEQLLAALERARADYDNSEARKKLSEGIQQCPEGAGCYEAYQELMAFQGNVELTEHVHRAIAAAAERWRVLSAYCPHCSQVVDKNRNTEAYQNYKKILNRVSQRLGVPPAAVLGIELPQD